MRFTMVLITVLLVSGSSYCAETNSLNEREFTPSAERRMVEIQKNDSIRSTCVKKYGKEIAEKTGNLKILLQGFFHQNQTMLQQKYANDPELNSIVLKIKAIQTDTTIHNVADKFSRLELLKTEKSKVLSRIHSDPEVIKVFNNYEQTKDQINQIIRTIITTDSECVSCMQIGIEK